jgi:hypothetical protein
MRLYARRAHEATDACEISMRRLALHVVRYGDEPARRHGPGISGAAGEANHVHRRPDEHRRCGDRYRPVIGSSYRLPSGDVALLERLRLLSLTIGAAVPVFPRMILRGQFREWQCSFSCMA